MWAGCWDAEYWCITQSWFSGFSKKCRKSIIIWCWWTDSCNQPPQHDYMDALCTGPFPVVTLSLSHIHITGMLYVQGHSLSSLSAWVTRTSHACSMYRATPCRHSQPESHPHHMHALCTGPFPVVTLSLSHIHITGIYVQGHSLSSLSAWVTSTSHACTMYRAFPVITHILSHTHITGMLYVQDHFLSSLSAWVLSTSHGCSMYRAIPCRHSQPESHAHHMDALCTGPFPVLTLSLSHTHIIWMLYVQGHSMSSLSAWVTPTSHACSMYRAIPCPHSQPGSHPHHMDALCTGPFPVVTLSLSHTHITCMLYVQGHSLSSLSAWVTSTSHGCSMYRAIPCRHSQPESHPHHMDALCTGPFPVITLSLSHTHITWMYWADVLVGKSPHLSPTFLHLPCGLRKCNDQSCECPTDMESHEQTPIVLMCYSNISYCHDVMLLWSSDDEGEVWNRQLPSLIIPVMMKERCGTDSHHYCWCFSMLKV